MQNSDWFLATKLLSGEHIINEKSTIVQVVTWCSQATAITWPNVDPNVKFSPYGVTKYGFFRYILDIPE